MVLIRAIFLAALAGCIKDKPPVVAPSSVDVASTITLSTADTAHGVELPAEMSQTIKAVLNNHRLNHRKVPAPAEFGARRSTDQRLTWLATNNDASSILLLLELSARRYDNIGGRYRWVVDVQLSLAPQSNLDRVQIDQFSVPVHLRHAHEDATDAARASLPTIERRLTRALDGYLAGASSP